MLSRRKVYYFIFLVLLLSCKDGTPTEENKDKVFGSYRASTFVEPGSLDAGVDILQAGGKFTVTLAENFKASGNLLIPENIGSNYPKGEKNFDGYFIINKDTVKFQDTSTLLDNPQLFFIHKNSSLESGAIIGRGGLFKIIFVKQ